MLYYVTLFTSDTKGKVTMQTIPTMTRLTPRVRKFVEDIATERKWKISFTVSQLLENYLTFMEEKSEKIA